MGQKGAIVRVLFLTFFSVILPCSVLWILEHSVEIKEEVEMQFIQNECQLGNYLSINSMDRRIHGESSSTEMAVVGKSSRSMAEEAASKSHSEAERRRRKRINGHLATLRSLLPNTIKVSKHTI